MPKLNTRRELELKEELSKERERRHREAIQRERAKQATYREKKKNAPK